VSRDDRQPAGWEKAVPLHLLMPRLRGGIAVVLALICFAGGVLVAQRRGVIEGAGAGIRSPRSGFKDGRFTICKWMFRSVRSEPSGVGWSTDYPFGQINLLTRCAGRSGADRIRSIRSTSPANRSYRPAASDYQLRDASPCHLSRQIRRRHSFIATTIATPAIVPRVECT
jgi:hypothetical protein